MQVEHPMFDLALGPHADATQAAHHQGFRILEAFEATEGLVLIESQELQQALKPWCVGLRGVGGIEGRPVHQRAEGDGRHQRHLSLEPRPFFLQDRLLTLAWHVLGHLVQQLRRLRDQGYQLTLQHALIAPHMSNPHGETGCSLCPGVVPSQM